MSLQQQLARILGKRMAYRRTFNAESVDVQAVLADLRDFCNATKPTTRVSPVSRTIDPIAMAIAEGRREVWLRIMAHVNMTDRDIQQLQHLDNTGEDSP